MFDRSSASSSPEVGPRVGVVVVAAGAGARMGGSISGRKQYADLGGEPLLVWAIRPFLAEPQVGCIVVVLAEEDCPHPPEWLTALNVRVVPGGAQRMDSVRNGLAALDPATEIVLVHDAARPFVTGALIQRVIHAAGEGAAVPALPVTDTVKQVDDGGRVIGTLDRAWLRSAQTPQGFSFPLLVGAHRRAAEEGWSATDDSALCERIGMAVRVVEGDPRNLKITNPIDLDIARCIAPTLAEALPIRGERPPGE